MKKILFILLFVLTSLSTFAFSFQIKADNFTMIDYNDSLMEKVPVKEYKAIVTVDPIQGWIYFNMEYSFYLITEKIENGWICMDSHNDIIYITINRDNNEKHIVIDCPGIYIFEGIIKSEKIINITKASQLGKDVNIFAEDFPMVKQEIFDYYE